MAKKKFQDLNLSDAFLFAAVMQDPETCRMTLEVLLNRSVKTVTVHAEHAVMFSSENRSIRLDVFAQNDEGDYNVEMQGEDKGNLPKRSRYHQAEMDVASIPPGADFNDLKASYVIFICSFDPFGDGLYQYTFENSCRETRKPLEDGTTKIFLNTQGRVGEGVSTELIHFLQYIEESTERCALKLADENVSRLHERVQTLKQSRDWESRYMKFEEMLQDAEKKGIEQGIKQGQERLLNLINRMTEAGEAEAIPRLSKDAAFLQEMYIKYQI